MRHTFSLANMSAGFVAVLVGFTSSAVLVFQAAKHMGASEAEISSWILALGLSIAITCIGLSLRYRMPVLTGWSTPGAALLATSLGSVSMPEAIGAFIFCAFLTLVFGVTGLFNRLINYIPRSLSSAMLAGILFHFGANVFVSMQQQFGLVCAMFVTYLLGKRFFPRYVIVGVLLLGGIMAWKQGLFDLQPIQWTLSKPIFTTPVFTFSALISIGLPLFFVNMASQYIPGIAVIKAHGYNLPVSKTISWIGLSTLCFAPFGCYSVTLAAITGAICMGKEADNNPAMRYKATIFAGLCWLIIALFSASIVQLFQNFPAALATSLAGLALLSTIGNSLHTALENEHEREAALITILMCSSGFSLYGIGAAFWGLAAGIITLFLLRWRKKEPTPATATVSVQLQ